MKLYNVDCVWDPTAHDNFCTHSWLWLDSFVTIEWMNSLVCRVVMICIADIYHWYIRYFCLKISDIFDMYDFYGVFKKKILMWQKNDVNSPCVLLAYDLCPQHFLSVGQLLSDCTSPQQCSVNDESTSPNMRSTHTHILLFGSKFYILAMYVQMHMQKKSDFSIFLIFSEISRYFQTLLACVVTVCVDFMTERSLFLVFVPYSAWPLLVLRCWTTKLIVSCRLLSLSSRDSNAPTSVRFCYASSLLAYKPLLGQLGAVGDGELAC